MSFTNGVHSIWHMQASCCPLDVVNYILQQLDAGSHMYIVVAALHGGVGVLMEALYFRDAS